MLRAAALLFFSRVLSSVSAAQRRDKKFSPGLFQKAAFSFISNPIGVRNFAFPAKFQPMALCYGGGPLRRSEGVWKICPARSEAEE